MIAQRSPARIAGHIGCRSLRKVKRARVRSVAAATLAVAAFGVSAPAAFAQSEPWKHSLALYLMGSSMDGTVGLGPVTATIDASFSDILDHLKAGMMGAYQARHGDLTLGVDLMFMSVEGTSAPGPNLEFHAEADFTVVSAEAAYRMGDSLEVIGGARFTDIDAEAGSLVNGTRTRITDRTQSWVDPYVGVRWTKAFADKWSLVLRGDYGGFGVGSDNAWQAVARADWHTSDALDVLFGFRVLDTDYADGEGADRFVFDVQSRGPVVGVAWRF